MSKRKRDESPEPMPELTKDGPKEVSIARNPDVMFALNNEANTHCLVNSSILRNTSTVFNAMLGPNFKEGQQIRAYHLGEANVTLPTIKLDDHPKAMMAVLFFLHGRNNNIAKLTSADVKNMSVISDKYDLKQALKLFSRVMLDVKTWNNLRDLTRLELLLAAYNFRYKKHFQNVSAALIFENTSSYLSIMKLDGAPAETKLWIAASLEEKRNAARLSMIRVARDHMEWPRPCSCDIELKDRLFWLEPILESVTPARGTEWPSIRSGLKKLNSAAVSIGKERCQHSRVLNKTKPGIAASQLQKIIADIETTHCDGLCLYCVGGKEEHSEHN